MHTTVMPNLLFNHAAVNAACFVRGVQSHAIQQFMHNLNAMKVIQLNSTVSRKLFYEVLFEGIFAASPSHTSIVGAVLYHLRIFAVILCVELLRRNAL